MPERFDLVVVGAGPGGYVAAIRAAQLGKKVACVDRRSTLGGTCLNVGCIPSKALLDSSEHYVQAKNHFPRHGILCKEVNLDLMALLRRKDSIVKSLVEGVAFLFKKNGVTAFHGAGKLLSGNQVEVTQGDGKKTILEAPAILLATGSEPATLHGLKPDGKHIVTSTEALNFPKVPEHLIVVGGGYIGLELGSVWLRLGSKVTVIEFLPRLLPNTDTEIANLTHKSLTKQGMIFHLGTKVTGASAANGVVTLQAQGPDGERSFQADHVLVATGRRPYTAGLGLDTVGVKTDEKSGRVLVDSQFRTSVSSVYAIGDLIAGPMLAHKASEEGLAVAERLAGHASPMHYDFLPSVIYIWPEVASVGQTEEQLKEAGHAYRVGKFPFAANGRAKCLDETEGLVKILSDAKTDRVLGVHIFGPRASDMIAEAVAIMEFSGSAEDIARIVHGHPTLSEVMGEAARAAYFGKALHM